MKHYSNEENWFSFTEVSELFKIEGHQDRQTSFTRFRELKLQQKLLSRQTDYFKELILFLECDKNNKGSLTRNVELTVMGCGIQLYGSNFEGIPMNRSRYLHEH